jgi:ATP-binding cassette subfamily F protein uup
LTFTKALSRCIFGSGFCLVLALDSKMSIFAKKLMANILSLDKLERRIGGRVLFSGISVGIAEGEKVGLVGLNGCGKTTLLRTIAGIESADSGESALSKSAIMGFLTQTHDFRGFNTVRDVFFDKKDPLLAVIAHYEDALNGQGDLEAATDAMQAADAWSLEYRIKEVLGKLNIHDLSQPTSQLSGGQAKRVALAKVLLTDCNFLILDEPTNHLDLEMVEWLEEELSQKGRSVLMVSHDRYFLDNVVDTIWEIEDGQLYRYAGNYAYFLEKRTERIETAKTIVDKARNLFSRELEWLRRQPKARGTKAKYRVEAAEELRKTAESRPKDQQVELSAPMQRMGKKILELHGISKSYSSKILFQNFDHVFRRGERVGIVGPNGAGKTTLLKVLLGETQPDTGYIETGENTVFGYYRQDLINYDESMRVMDAVSAIADAIATKDGSIITPSQLLTRFLFPPSRQYDYIYKLSGGEKRRLQLLLVLIKQPNFLILDEPTNDLDIFTLQVLEDFLSEFGGCVVVVSHDRFFMDKLVEHIFAFENGYIKDYPGNYSQYRAALAASELEKPKEAPKKIQPKTQEKPKSKLSFKEQKEYQSLEAEIAELEEKKSTLTSQMQALPYEQIAELSRQIQTIEQQIESKTNRWLELAEMI